MRLYKEQGSRLTEVLEPIRFDDEVGNFHAYFRQNIAAILGLEGDPKTVLHHENIEGKEIDFLIVDSLDRVYFVEIKLGKNPENRREVINQIVDYWSRCRNYVSNLRELSNKARNAIEKGYVNPVIVTDDLLDDHRNILPNIKLGENNVKIRLIEVKRWKVDDKVYTSTNTINDQEPIAVPTRETRTKDELISMIDDPGLKSFAKQLDALLTRYRYVIRQRSKSRLAYTREHFTRLFVFVCTNPVWGDKVGDFIVTTEYSNIGVREDIWQDSNITWSGRKDDWGGKVYELSGKTEEERGRFLEFLEKVLIETDRYLAAAMD